MTVTPADLARRASQPQAPTPAPQSTLLDEAIAPGRLHEGERFKPTYHWGLMLSGLLPEARLLGYTLLWYARHSDGHISPTYQPNLDQLSAASGLSPARVSTQIEILRQRGWLRLSPVPDGPRAGAPRYDLTIPALHLERIRAKRAERSELNLRNRAAHERRRSTPTR